MADKKMYKVGITVKEPWASDISYEVLDITLYAVENGGDGCSYTAIKPNQGVTPGTDDTVWVKSTQAGQSIYDLAVKYHHFVGTEEEFEQQYQDALAAANNAASAASATDEQIQANELARVSAENSRVTAERARSDAETARSSAETARINAENARNNAESLRNTAESDRVRAEAGRVTAEASRVEAETFRQGAEQSRRQQFEGLKTDMETAIDNVDAKAAEIEEDIEGYEANEAGRVSAENARAAAESARVSAEQGRAAAETARQTAEGNRATAETERASAEGTRTTAEQGRVSAEQGRVSAESGRVSAESERVAAETARESASATAVQNAETATAAANTAAEHAEEAAVTIDDKIAGKANTDGYYGGMTVGTAENLVGRGSVEAEYQGIRTSAGSEDIGNGSATIREMRGKSIVWNQLCSTSFPKSRLQFNNTEGSSRQFVYSGIVVNNIVAGHKFLFCTDFTIEENNSVTHSLTYLYSYQTSNGQLITNELLKKAAGRYRRTFIQVAVDTRAKQFYYWSVDAGDYLDVTVNSVIAIDLTLMFGAGNEPATVEELEAMFPLPYYEYNAGTLVNNEATGIRTRGFNLYNHATGKAVLPGKYSDYPYEYEICGAFTSISFEDYAGNVSTPELHDGRFFNVPSPGVLTVTGGNDTDTLVHLVWSGWRNFGEPDYAYEKYWENTLQLNIKSITGKLNGEGDSVTIFPEGMRSAGTAYDSLIVDPDGYARRAVVRMGSVDLGTLSWMKGNAVTGNSNYNAFYSYDINSIQSKAVICGKYEANNSHPAAWESIGVLKIGTPNNRSIIIIGEASTYTEATLKTALSGVELVYELATPLVYVLDSPIPMTYPVDDFSIEAKLPVDTAELPTGPIRYAVTYPMNAVDPLRRLPTNYMSKESMQNFLTALKTAGIIADFTMTYNSTTGAYTFTITAPSTEPANTNESEL